MRLRVVLVVLVVLAVLAAVGAYLLVQHIDPRLPTTLGGRACEVTTGSGEVQLDSTQMANAATISAVGLRRKLPVRAVVVALATAFQESKLENLEHGDRDSLGLFQQRPSQGWGTAAQVRDPRYSAGKFYSALVKVRGWEKLRVTDAAQRVQRSAYPELYEQWEDEATILAEALSGTATAAVTCAVPGSSPQSRGAVAAQELTDGLKLDWGTRAKNASADASGLVLPAANAQIGWQYAHWLVAHATERGVSRVQFGAREWTARGGRWTTVDGSAATAAGDVVAQVYA